MNLLAIQNSSGIITPLGPLSIRKAMSTIKLLKGIILAFCFVGVTTVVSSCTGTKEPTSLDTEKGYGGEGGEGGEGGHGGLGGHGGGGGSGGGR